jgi:hypothetical protein
LSTRHGWNMKRNKPIADRTRASRVDPADGSLNEARMRCFREHMEECERATRAGNLPAIVDAVEYCVEFNLPPPRWVVDAVVTTVLRLMVVRRGDGRFNSRLARWNDNQKHFARWDAVQELLDSGRYLYENRGDKRGLKEDSAFKAVVEWLKDTSAKGSKSTIERSYRLVEKTRKTSGFKFYLTDFKPNGYFIKKGGDEFYINGKDEFTKDGFYLYRK